MAYDRVHCKRELRKIGQLTRNIVWKFFKSFPSKNLGGMVGSTFLTSLQLLGLALKAGFAVVRLILKT